MSHLLIKFVGIVIVTAFLLSCGGRSHVAVVERATLDPRVASEKMGGDHIRIIQRGDTLYSIAFQNKLDVNKLAAWNHLKDSSRLKVGQRIRLTQPVGFRYKASQNEQAITQSDRSKTTSVDKQYGTPPQVQSQTSKPAHSSASTASRAKWSWPVTGSILKRFSESKGQQGIDIGVKSGSLIRAARAGTVVYVGNGLKGYGNLIIIKHDQRFLSAYAQNAKSLVSEGQAVKAKQTIATSGRNARGVEALHFQIRIDGEPKDPLKFLP